MARRNKIKPKVEDVFTFSINGNRNCFGQIVAPQVEQYGEKLYVLFDYVTAKEDMGYIDIEAIAAQPILAIARINDFCIQDGEWKIIGNTEIYHAERIVLPHYIIGDWVTGKSVVVIKSYDGKIIRNATDEEVNEALHGNPMLEFWGSVTPNAFEAIARDKYDEKSETNIFELPFEGSKWDASANEEGIPLKALLMRNEEVLIAIQEGFDCFESDDYTNVIIRLALSIEGFGTEEDLEKKNQIEDILGASLHLTGNGGCEGSEIGNGEMLIYCYVIDKEKAIETINLELKKDHFLEGAEII